MTLDPRGGLYSPCAVPFILRTTTGADAGKEYPFDGGEATLGRTADNDIVVKDAAASRAHARVYEKKGKFFVEDLGSANGTRVNGAAIKAPKELKGGEIVAIGDVEYEFEIPVEEEEEPPRPSRAEDPHSTMDEQGPEFRSTIDPDAAGDDPGATGEVERKPPKALAKKGASKPKRRAGTEDEPEDEAPPDEEEPPPDDEDAPPEEEPQDIDLSPKPRTSLAKALGLKEVQQSAAERARERRAMQQSIGGKLMLAFRDMPGVAKVIVALVLVVVVVGSLGGAIYLATRPDKPPRPEPLSLVPDADPIPDVFGEGEGVDYRRTAEKSFDFSLNKAMRTVAVLHYQAKGIDSKDEVRVTLNGTDIESVPPDNLDVDNRTNEMVLPADIIKPRDLNTLIFDNTKNPPAKDEWRIWNVWVETIPVPEVTSEEAGRQGRITIDNAEKSCTLKNVGADALFKCWKLYRESWLLLESTPNRPEEVLSIARQRLKEVRPELDRKCSAMLIEYQKEVNKSDHTRARAALQDIIRHFPTREHHCHNDAKSYLHEYEGVEVESSDGEDDYYQRNLKVKEKKGCGGCSAGDLALAPIALGWLLSRRRRRCAAA